MTSPDPHTQPKPATDKELSRQELRTNQVIGVVVGVLGGWISGSFWPELPATMPLGWGGVLIWGAAIGAVLGSLPQLAHIGKAITRRDNGILNGAVALSIPLLIILLLALLFRAV